MKQLHCFASVDLKEIQMMQLPVGMSPQLWNHPNVSVMWKCNTSGSKHILLHVYRLLYCLLHSYQLAPEAT